MILFLSCVLIHHIVLESHQSNFSTVIMLQNHIIRSFRLIINPIYIRISLNILLRLFTWRNRICIISRHLLLQELLHRLVMLLVTVGLIILLLQLIHANGVVLSWAHAFNVLGKLILQEVGISRAEVTVGGDLFPICCNYLLHWFFSWNNRDSWNSRDSMINWIATFSIIII